MPGGGKFVNTGFVVNINNAGDVVFNATLDTRTNGLPDTGLFIWSHGSLGVVARTGTVIPGVGTVAALATGEMIIPPPPTFFPNSGPYNNDRGQVFFAVTLTDQRSVLLVATPGD